MVYVDMVVPLTISTPCKTLSLLALTMIDQIIIIGWLEIVKATDKSATSFQDLFQKIRLARYLRPQHFLFNIGDSGKFKREFIQMCDNYGIKDKPNTGHNHHQSTSKFNH
jgi:hypothetical protein